MSNLYPNPGLIIFVVCQIFTTITHSQTPGFERFYGTSGLDKSRDLCQTDDGGFVSTGLLLDGSDRHVFLLKTNSSGDSLWVKTHPKSVGSDGWSIKKTFDNGFIVGGYLVNIPLPQDLYILKTDSLGNKVWDNQITHQEGSFALSVIQDNDSNYVTCGYISGNGLYICKFGQQGDTIWTKIITSQQNVQGWYIENTFDNNYIITGTNYSGGSSNVIIIKMDYNGGVIWQKIYGTSNRDYGLCVIPTVDNNYLISGYSTNSTSFITHGLLIKVDAFGELIWIKNYPATKWKAFWSLAELPNSEGYIMTGQITDNSTPTDHNVYLLKTDTAGNELWSKEFGGAVNEHGHNLILTADGGFAIAGYTNSIGYGDFDIYLIKTDSNGNLLTGISNLISDKNKFHIYPNPTRSNVKIENIEAGTIQILNLMGEVIYDKFFNIGARETIELDISLRQAEL
jgi:hypothetical protein